uniref:uncharacterized protein LOC103791176 n=1 Tax=Callithrix jacchus TaxID=9483 RepID=UPI0023DCF421|nr:uncharacterized protein LOC103791176 [Callithrix jacchus]
MGDPAKGVMTVKRDMAAKQMNPGGPQCTGKRAGLDAALITTRAPRAVRLETTFPRGPGAERAGKRAPPIQCAGAGAISGYIKEVPGVVRSFASAVLLKCWCCGLRPRFIRHRLSRRFLFFVWLEQPEGTMDFGGGGHHWASKETTCRHLQPWIS